MKKIGITICTILLFSFTEEDKLSSYVHELDKCETASQFARVAEKLGTLEASSDQDWYPSYYTAFSYVLSAFAQTDYGKIDETLDLAQIHLDKAQEMAPENDEIFCVASMITSARIMVNPAERGYEFGQKSGLLIEKARLINPDNPRVYYLIGQSKMYMPAEYGGGCENAKPILEEAMKKYNSFEKADANAPSWGKKETKALLEGCS